MFYFLSFNFLSTKPPSLLKCKASLATSSSASARTKTVDASLSGRRAISSSSHHQQTLARRLSPISHQIFSAGDYYYHLYYYYYYCYCWSSYSSLRSLSAWLLFLPLLHGSSSQCSQMDYSSTRSVFPRPRSPTPSSFLSGRRVILSPPIRPVSSPISLDRRANIQRFSRSFVPRISQAWGRLSGREGRPRRPSSRESPRRKNPGIETRRNRAFLFCFVLRFKSFAASFYRMLYNNTLLLL